MTANRALLKAGFAGDALGDLSRYTASPDCLTGKQRQTHAEAYR
jgi:hypothetical protein